MNTCKIYLLQAGMDIVKLYYLDYFIICGFSWEATACNVLKVVSEMQLWFENIALIEL